MNLASVKEGDVVRCDVRGDTFFALVLRDRDKVKRGEKWVEPISRSAPPRIVTARQIVGHYRKSKRSR